MASWSELHFELVEKIGKQLITANLADYIRLRAVCKYWRSATLVPSKMYLHPQLPWIILSFQNELYYLVAPPPRLSWSSMVTPANKVKINDIRSFLSVSTDTLKVNELSLPFHRPTRIAGTADGWLVVIDIALMVYLFNPLTHEQVRLPQLEGYGDEGENEEIQKYLLSKVIILPDGTVVGNASSWNRLLFTRLGEKKWTPILDVPVKFIDIISYQGAIYGVNIFGVVARCEIGPPATIMQITTSEHGYRDRWYLVESLKGELLLVAHLDKKFNVFKLGQEEGKLIEIESLGDQMVFLNTCNRSFCLSASDFPGWEGNRIYIAPFSYEVDEEDEDDEDDIQCDNFGIYNLEDGTYTRLSFINRDPDYKTFTWFTPRV